MFSRDAIIITVTNHTWWLEELLPLVGSLARRRGFGYRESRELELAFEEAFVNTCTHAFEGERAPVTITLQGTSLGMEMVLRDQGIPFGEIPENAPGENAPPDSPDQVPSSGLGMKLMRRTMDEIRFVNLGPQGKEVRLIKHLPHVSVSEEPEAPPEKAFVEKAPKTPFVVRPMHPEEAGEICRSAWRAYGYSYPNPAIYYPERLRSLNENEELLSALAVARETGEIMGHAALEIPSQGKTVEIGMAFVNPRFRGQKCLETITDWLLGTARDKGHTGALVQSVTTHVASQRAALSQGFRETALLVGSYPQQMSFKKIKEEQKQRLSLLHAFLPLGHLEPEPLHLPEEHASMIRGLLSGAGIPFRNFCGKPEPLGKDAAEVTTCPHLSNALIRVPRWGEKTASRILQVLHHLILQKFDSVVLSLPLNTPITEDHLPLLQERGFFFGGIDVDTSRGTHLLLQYLNVPPLDYEKIMVYSDQALRLKNYIRSKDPGQSEAEPLL